MWMLLSKKQSKCSKYNSLQECDNLSEEFGNLLDINEGSSSSVINNATSFKCKLEVQGKQYNYNDIREVLWKYYTYIVPIIWP